MSSYGSKLPVISLRYLPGLPQHMALSFCDYGQEVLIVWVSRPLNPLEHEMMMRQVTEALRLTTRPCDGGDL